MNGTSHCGNPGSQQGPSCSLMVQHQFGMSVSRRPTAAPAVVVCQESYAQALQLAIHKLGYHNFLYFATGVEFMRWFFGWYRDGGRAISILVTGWREAKPCAAAIHAIRTGCVDHLRPDAKRPQLTACDGSKGGTDAIGDTTANVAIGHMMVVILPHGQSTELMERQEKKAAKWAASDDASGLNVDIVLTKDTTKLASALNASMRRTGTKASVGLTAADPGTIPVGKSVAAPCNESADHASVTSFRPRTPSPVYIYRPRTLPSRCTHPTSWLQQAGLSTQHGLTWQQQFRKEAPR
mmetsp:Transcript_59374/g.143333  ORF Transcript_59374/g.143333 Transcript_59374/m.143333 type:complete len:295 (+) Transcript_59374:64-948(+)